MSEAFESQLSELLRRLNQARQVRILEPIASMTGRVLDNNPVFHWMLVFSALLLVICVYAEIKQLTLFSLHPVCMSIGVLVFLAEGAVSFKNRVLFEFFSPIMQHSARAKTRALHKTCQIVGSCFLCLGMVFILSHKAKWHKPIIPGTLHAWIGVLCGLMILVQIFSGFEKVENLELLNVKSRRWHGDLGLVLWDMLVLAILTVAVVVVWVMVHSQLKRRSEEYKYDSDAEGSNASSSLTSSPPDRERGGTGGGGSGSIDGSHGHGNAE